jgi:hypothetical protein
VDDHIWKLEIVSSVRVESTTNPSFDPSVTLDKYLSVKIGAEIFRINDHPANSQSRDKLVFHANNDLRSDERKHHVLCGLAVSMLLRGRRIQHSFFRAENHERMAFLAMHQSSCMHINSIIAA